MDGSPLSPDGMDLYARTVNYLAVGPIDRTGNPLLEDPRADGLVDPGPVLSLLSGAGIDPGKDADGAANETVDADADAARAATSTIVVTARKDLEITWQARPVAR
jgi:hypothetical protein